MAKHRILHGIRDAGVISRVKLTVDVIKRIQFNSLISTRMTGYAKF